MAWHRKDDPRKYRTGAVTEALMEPVVDLKLRRLEAMRRLSEELGGPQPPAVATGGPSRQQAESLLRSSSGHPSSCSA